MRILQATGYFTGYGPGTEKKETILRLFSKVSI